MECKTKTFRFNFNNETVNLLMYFSRIHQYDNLVDYKESWKRWYDDNDVDFEKEANRLRALGYKRDVEEKMYKAARYYFRKKLIVEDPQQDEMLPISRPYISLNPELLLLMDKHIKKYITIINYTPAIGFNDFSDLYKDSLEMEHRRLLNNSQLNKKSIDSKIKKTYKNRYSLYIKK